MKRDIYQDLVAWKGSTRRKPLLLKGARQTGKTYLLKEFGQQEYEQVCYFNFEEEPGLKDLFNSSLNPVKLLSNLAIFLKKEIRPGRDLIVFDEIQVSNEALNALKYFAEDANDYHIAAAGSLLGVKLSKQKSFPVGKVNFINLHPLTFVEFLNAVGESRYRDLLQSLTVPEPLPPPFHEELLGLLRKYCVTGGMPEVVDHYARTGDLPGVREIQKEILSSYVLDFAKHAPTSDIPKLSLIWNSIPAQLARENRKFMFSAIRSGARAREYENALIWLDDAGLIHRAFPVTAPRLPLSSYANRDAFKVYTMDVGLLGAMSGLSPSALIEGNRLFTEFKGALTENFVAQQLHSSFQSELFYWTSQAQAEVDFICQANDLICPLEVKSGENTRARSLTSYAVRYHPPWLVSATLMNFKRTGSRVNIPLYAMSTLPSLLGHLNATDGSVL